MENQFCSICLTTETRLILFSASEHKHLIKNIITKSGFDPISHDNECICYECKALLVKSYNFIQKAVTGHLILQNMLKETDIIPLDVIKSLDRTEFNLNMLTIQNKGIDFYFTEDMENSEYNLDFTNINVKVEEVHYNEDYAMSTEEDDIKVELFDDTEYNAFPKKETKEKNQKKNVTKTKKRTTKAEKKKNITKPKVKKQRVPLVPSKFMQNLPFVTGKRARKEVKYQNLDVKGERDDKDEYQPSSESSDTNSVDLYNDSGKRLVQDLRVFPMLCEECPVEILNKTQHHYHYMEDHPKVPYPYRNMRAKTLLCPMCGRSFALNSRLEDHMRTHTAEKKEECDKCGKKFVRRVQLRRHMKRHDETIKYECDVCKKTFKTRMELKTHVRIHSGAKPYKCHICGAGFAHNGNVGVHIRSKHQQAPSGNRQKNNSNNPRKSTKHKLSNIDCENGIKDSPSTSNYELEKTLDKKDNSLDQFEFFEQSIL